MCLKRSLAATALVLLVSSVGFGQSLLQQLEGKLKSALESAAPVAAPADAAAAEGTPAPGYLGLVADDAAEAGKGIRVISTKAKGPAEAGGLKADDLITAIDGKPIASLTDLDAVLGKAVVGQKLRMTVQRAMKLQSLVITLGPRPGAPPAAEPALTDPSAALPLDPLAAPAEPAPATTKTPAPIRSKPATKPLDLGAPPADPPLADPALADPATELPAPAAADPSARPSLGITVVPLTDEARERFALTVRRGALITNVRPGSPADTAGLPVGGVVVALDGKRIDTADDLVNTVRTGRVGQEIELTYYEADRLARKTVRLAPAASGIVAAPGATPPGIGPQASDPTAPFGLKLGGPDRPLLNKVEQLVEGFAPRTAPGAVPRGPSTVYDPSEMAALRDHVLKLQEEIASLEERVKLLESKLGDAAPAANPLPGGLGGAAAPAP